MAETRSAFQWEPISDLSEDLSRFRDRELEALFHAWTTQLQTLSQQQALAQFNAELKREWAIETGIIEGVYTLERGVTHTLIQRGIEARHIPDQATNRDPELVARIIQAHAEVLEGLFAFIKGERPLSTSYIKELHAALLKHQQTATVFNQFGDPFETELRKGDYKTVPNNPSREDGSIHEYCPPEHVASEMDRLVALHAEHIESRLRPEIQAAWLHHAFTQIHPFQDGNGRVARAIASLVFLKAGYFPLVVARDDRPKYIDSLEFADSGDLRPLVQIFSSVQKRLLTKAIGLAIDVKPAATVGEAIEATRDLLVGLGQIIPKDWLKAKSLAGSLTGLAETKLRAMLTLLAEELTSVDPKFTFSAGQLGGAPLKAYETISQKLKYDPDPSQYHDSRVLTLKSPRGNATITVSFHGIGASYRGLLAVSAFFQAENSEVIPLSDDIFRISYEEPKAEIEARFGPWLEASLVNGIGIWRRSLV